MKEQKQDIGTSPSSLARSGLKNTPSPRINGERVGVRGKQVVDFHRET
jgi:hypothetical protein